MLLSILPLLVVCRILKNSSIGSNEWLCSSRCLAIWDFVVVLFVMLHMFFATYVERDTRLSYVACCAVVAGKGVYFTPGVYMYIYISHMSVCVCVCVGGRLLPRGIGVIIFSLLLTVFF
jgi:hypothetical protein